jgi:hypothetical protein
MAINEGQTVGDALTNKFLTLFKNSGTAAVNSYLSIIDGGYPYGPSDLKWLANFPPQEPNDINAAAAFASQVDRIPAGVGRWVPGAAQISSPYRSLFLQNAETPSVKLTPEQQADLDEAEKTLKSDYHDYTQYRNTYQQAAEAVQELMLKVHRPSDYMQQLSKLRTSMNNAKTDWENLGNKDEVETALATKNHLQGLGYDQIITNLRDQYDNYKDLYPTPDGTTFTPVLAIPGDFYTDAITWNTFTFSSEEISKYQHDSTVQWGGGLGGAWDLFWGSGDASGEKHDTYLEVETQKLGVSFDYIRVTLDRTAWFDPFFLESQSWYWPGATKNNPQGGGSLFSNGLPLGAGLDGQWQMTPQDVIFTKNLNVTLDMSDETTKTTLSRLTTSASAGFWFFRIKASYSSQTSTYEYDYQETHSGISAPQMQMFAFLCTLMPKEPNPLPSILPDE